MAPVSYVSVQVEAAKRNHYAPSCFRKATVETLERHLKISTQLQVLILLPQGGERPYPPKAQPNPNLLGEKINV